jgi:two-component system chemotaxis sensor kinase CheA
MVGELVITQAMLTQQIDDHLRERYPDIVRGLEVLAQYTRSLQDSVMSIRAQPVKSVFSRMGRLVRDLSGQLGKKVRLEMIGEGTEIDKTVIEQLADPLTHMIRNSLDHGIETPEKRLAAGKGEEGTTRLSAEQAGGRIVIQVADDGAGINRSRVLAKAIAKGIVAPNAQLGDEEVDQLIFAPGFSTAEAVTSVSGSGVGMDVVRQNIQRLGGRVTVRNAPGRGATLVLTLPLTLAVLDVMLVRVGDTPIVIPLASIVESMTREGAAIGHLPLGAQVIKARGAYVSLLHLADLLGVGRTDGTEERDSFLILCEADGDQRVALTVDAIHGQQQVVIKSIEANFDRIEGVAGATILGDGAVALILDIVGRKRVAERRPPVRTAA